MKNNLFIGLAILLIIGLAMSACESNNDDLPVYKVKAKAILTAYVESLNPDDYSYKNWAVIEDIANTGKENISAAASKQEVDTALTEAKEEISMIDKGIVFPSVMEEFALEDFTEEFFKSNTLILVPFEWGHILLSYIRDNLRFYTVYVENGKLNFLIELPYPDTGGDRGIDMRIFAVIIPNRVIRRYEIGGSIVFKAYEYNNAGDMIDENFTLNCREWIKEVEKNAVQHRVGYAYDPNVWPDGKSLWSIGYHPWGYMKIITVISSLESLHEHFYVNAVE